MPWVPRLLLVAALWPRAEAGRGLAAAWADAVASPGGAPHGTASPRGARMRRPSPEAVRKKRARPGSGASGRPLRRKSPRAHDGLVGGGLRSSPPGPARAARPVADPRELGAQASGAAAAPGARAGEAPADQVVILPPASGPTSAAPGHVAAQASSAGASVAAHANPMQLQDVALEEPCADICVDCVGAGVYVLLQEPGPYLECWTSHVSGTQDGRNIVHSFSLAEEPCVDSRVTLAKRNGSFDLTNVEDCWASWRRTPRPRSPPPGLMLARPPQTLVVQMVGPTVRQAADAFGECKTVCVECEERVYAVMQQRSRDGACITTHASATSDGYDFEHGLWLLYHGCRGARTQVLSMVLRDLSQIRNCWAMWRAWPPQEAAAAGPVSPT